MTARRDGESRPVTGMIVDDEPLARQHLRRLLEEQNITVIGEAGDAAMAIQLAEDLRPDVLFLDIQMPGLSGLQLAEAIHHGAAQTLVVFVTGYSEYAATAFEHAALDYLMKPVAPARLAKTLVRVRAQLRLFQQSEESDKSEPPTAFPSGEPVSRLPIRKDFSVRLVRVDEILCAVARDKRVYVRTQTDDEHRTYYTLTQLETLLPPALFLRVHDSCIVNTDAIEELLFLGNHSYAVRLAKGEPLPVGRSRYAALQQRLGIKNDP